MHVVALRPGTQMFLYEYLKCNSDGLLTRQTRIYTLCRPRIKHRESTDCRCSLRTENDSPHVEVLSPCAP
jgi:hypothetical protein